MDTQTLKRAAEFLGLENRESPYDMGIYQIFDERLDHFTFFAPHEEEGRHWLVKMILKLNDKQWSKYRAKMKSEHYAKPLMPFAKWLVTAKCSVCFPVIMEVLDGA